MQGKFSYYLILTFFSYKFFKEEYRQKGREEDEENATVNRHIVKNETKNFCYVINNFNKIHFNIKNISYNKINF